MKCLVTRMLYVCFLYCNAVYPSEQLKLVGQSVTLKNKIEITTSESTWLSQKDSLNVGIVLPAYEPFEIISTTGNYEGVSADVLKFISEQTNKEIVVKSYKDYSSAKKAVLNGDVDILSVGSSFLTDDNNAGLFSKPLFKSKLVFSTVNGRMWRKSLDGARVAVPQGLVDKDAFSKKYPKISLLEYSSSLTAMDAVYFNKADVLLSDIYSTRYLAGERFGDFVLIEQANYPPKEFSFFISKKEPELTSIVNKAIVSLDEYGGYSILSRWNGAITELHSIDEILTQDEKSWIKNKGSVIVGININDIPYTFIGHTGTPVGITCDVLNYISDLGGIRFKTKLYQSNDAVESALLSGEIDVIAVYKNNSQNRSISATINYNQDDIVVLTLDKDFVNKNQGFFGTRVAVSKEMIRNRNFIASNDKVEYIYVPSGIDALTLLKNGKVNGAVTSLYMSRYFLESNGLLDRYIFSERVFDEKIEISFGVRTSDEMLLKITDNLIQAIPTSDISKISYRWRNNPLPYLSFYSKYSEELTFSFILLVLALAMYLMRNRFLKKELIAREVLEGRLLAEINFKRSLLDGIPMPISVLDCSGRLIFCNKSHLKFFKVAESDIVGSTIIEAFSQRLDCCDVLDSIYKMVLSSGVELFNDYPIKLDGESMEIYHWVIPFQNINNDVEGVICGLIDITERKTLQVQYEIQKQKAEQASLAKSNFLAVMSHELRTPMNAIIGFVELALKKAMDGKIDTNALRQASDAADILLELIGGVLDISSAEADVFILNRQVVELQTLIKSTLSLLQSVANNRNNTIVFNCNYQGECYIYSDPVRIRQIVYNIVGNALKFTNDGLVKVTLDINKEHISVIVADNGIGIPASKINELFTPFSQLHGNYSSGYYGSGLGLSIVKRICELMGGEINVSSIEGCGTTVSIMIPNTQVHDNELTLHKTLPRAGSEINLDGNIKARVLVADDHAANQLLMKEQLTYFGCDVFLASDGVEALNIYKTIAVDVVLTDCQMPNMDGFSLAHEIRKLENKTGRKKVAIYGLTASGMKKDYDKCIDSGMDDCFFKPFKFDTLSYEIKKFMSQGDVERPNKVSWKIALLDEFMACNIQDLTSLDECLQQCDDKGALHFLHRIKGSCQVLGADKIVSLCKQIEDEYERGGVIRIDLISDVKFEVERVGQ
ncbi:UNVERIFIED_ORG: multi-sensor hybrid histidine kinase [Aeromonas veronii]